MILVLGGTGGIGSELLRLLSEAGVGARAIGAAIGKPLRFVDESPEDARARRMREGMPPPSSRVLWRSPCISVPVERP